MRMIRSLEYPFRRFFSAFKKGDLSILAHEKRPLIFLHLARQSPFSVFLLVICDPKITCFCTFWPPNLPF